MFTNYSISLTEKLETSSAGALQKDYRDLSNPNPLIERQLRFKINSTGKTEFYQNDHISELLWSQTTEQYIPEDEVLRKIFSQLRSKAQFYRLEDIPTSSISFPSSGRFLEYSFPSEVSSHIDTLWHGEGEERVLYESADQLSEWLTHDSNELVNYHFFLSDYLQKILAVSSRILLASLSDAEFSTNNKMLLDTVCLFIKSEDIELAQAAVNFLITCGGSFGEALLQEATLTQDLPHSRLVQGMQDLLT